MGVVLIIVLILVLLGGGLLVWASTNATIAQAQATIETARAAQSVAQAAQISAAGQAGVGMLNATSLLLIVIAVLIVIGLVVYIATLQRQIKRMRRPQHQPNFGIYPPYPPQLYRGQYPGQGQANPLEMLVQLQLLNMMGNMQPRQPQLPRPNDQEESW